MYTQDQHKAMVAEAAKDEVLKNMASGGILGVGTGSTANLFIDAIAPHQSHFSGVVSSSQASTERLQKHGFKVLDCNSVQSLPMYVDGADEIDPHGHMLKGGGGALTREKIVAQLAQHLHRFSPQRFRNTQNDSSNRHRGTLHRQNFRGKVAPNHSCQNE